MTFKLAAFCTDCGSRLTSQWIAEERRERRVCTQCGTIAYQNPQILVTTIVTSDSNVLLCRRAYPPAQGRWTSPSGFAECGETLEEAAAREIFEETQVQIAADDLSLYALSTLRDLGEVYVSFRAEVQDSLTACGPECLEVRYFSEEDFPWQDLAYPEMIGFYRLFFRERRAGRFSIHFTYLDAEEIVRSSYEIAAIERVREVQRPRSRLHSRTDD